jgi:hypothetical protein
MRVLIHFRALPEVGKGANAVRSTDLFDALLQVHPLHWYKAVSQGVYCCLRLFQDDVSDQRLILSVLWLYINEQHFMGTGTSLRI